MPSQQYTLEDTPKHAKTLEQYEELMKPVKLYLMDKDDLEV